MRLNRYVAQATGMSRRAADKAITEGRVIVDGSVVMFDGQPLELADTQTIMLNKPVGYVCSREGQGSKTIYDLLPPELHHLKPVGRLDKDSSGLLLMSNDGELTQKLTHPSFEKEKMYEVELSKKLPDTDQHKIEQGVQLEDGLSKLALNGSDKTWTVTMHEGRNRQIRRTFEALGYRVTKLHRVSFGDYRLGDLQRGSYQSVPR